MAFKMPEYQAQVQQAPVVPQNAPVVNASIAPGLAAIGRGVSDFGQGMGVYNARREIEERREQEKADQLRVRTVLAEVSSGSRDFLETPLDADGNGGFLNKRGENAIKASVDDSKVFQQFVEGKLEGLSPGQRALIQPSIIAELEKFNHIVDRHVHEQTNQLNEDTSKALLSNRTNAAMAAMLRGDRDTFQEEYGAGLGEIDNIANTMGEPIGGPVHAKRVADYTDGVRRGTIEALISSDPERAEALLAEWGDSLNQAQVKATKLDERVYDASAKVFGEALADQVVAQHGIEAPAIIEAMELKDISNEAKVQAVNAARKKLAIQDQLSEAKNSELLGKLSQSISRGQGLYTITDLESDPDFKLLDGSGKEKARAAAYNMVEAQRRAKSKNPGERKRQSEINKAWLSRYERMTLENPSEAINLDTDTWAQSADDQTRDEIASMRARAKEKRDKGLADSGADFMTELKGNIQGTALSKEQYERVLDYGTRWYKQRERELEGKPVPSKDTKAFIDSLQVDVKTKGAIWGTNTYSRLDAIALGKTIIDAAPAAAPVAATPANPGTTPLRDANGKVWNIPNDKVEEAIANGMKR